MHENQQAAVIIVGAGPGVSGSLARLWADAGHPIGLVGNDQAALDALAAELAERGVPVRSACVDVTDHTAATDALRQLTDDLGAVHCLHFNPSIFRAADPLVLTPSELLTDVGLGVGALLTAVQAVEPRLQAGSRITATGSMAADQPWSGAASLGVQKAGLRNLVLSLDATLAERDVRAVSVTVRGALAQEGPFTPDRVARAVFDAAHQSVDEWQAEVSYTG